MKIIYQTLRACGFLLLTASLSPATIYYVDSVNGSDQNDGKAQQQNSATQGPWKGDLLAPSCPLNNKEFQPGDQVLFKRGCSWTGSLSPRSSGTSSAPIVFDTYGAGLSPHIDGGGVSGTQTGTVKLWSKSYFIFQNFSISNNANDVKLRFGIFVSYTGVPAPSSVTTFTGLQILNNDIHHVAGDTTNNHISAALYVEITDYQGSQNLVKDLLIEDNYFYDNKCTGILTKGNNTMKNREDLWSQNTIIRGNVFDKGGADHIILNAAAGALIEKNAGYDAGHPSLTPHKGGYIAGMWDTYYTKEITFQHNEMARTRNTAKIGESGDSQAFDADYGTKGNHIFQYNYTHDNEGGVLIMMPKENKPGFVDLPKTVIYRYNLSVNDGRNNSSGVQMGVWPADGVSTVEIYNNVFYSTREDGFRFTNALAAKYTNNIFHMPEAVYPNKPVFSNNCYYGHVPEVNDPYMVTADPKFVGPLDRAGADERLPVNIDMFKLQTSGSPSPCINAGAAINGVVGSSARDFWQNPLYSGASADIGIHEVPNGSNAAPAEVIFTDNPDSATVDYFGAGWTHDPDSSYFKKTKSLSTTVGNSAKFTFTGTNVSLFGRRGPGYGKMNVSVDGGAPQLIDCYWGADLWRSEVFRATGLSNQSHTLTITVAAKNPAASGNYIAIDYFQQMPATPPALPVVATVDNPASANVVIYSSGWTHVTGNASCYAGTRSYATAVGSYVGFKFSGTGARIYGIKNRAYGKLSVSVDGGPARVIDTFDPGQSSKHMEKLFEVNGLTNGAHTLRATVATKRPLSAGNEVSIDVFQSLVGGSATPVEVVMDNTAATGVTFTGNWVSSTYSPGFYGTNYIHDNNTTPKTNSSVRFTPTLPSAGTYQVFACWTAAENRATNVPVDIVSNTGTWPVVVNQRELDSQWILLGIYTFNAGTAGSVLIRNGSTAGGTATNGHVVVDAVRFRKL